MPGVIYPLPSPIATHQLPVGDGHELAIYEYGNPDGQPVVVLHGGPGSGANQLQAAMFDPAYWRIICFDQRGCGKSKAKNKLTNNTTAALVEDIDTIRRHFAIEQWLVAGGSWGSTLALLYAIEHPDRVRGLILRGVFLARPCDTDWMYDYRGGAPRMFPEFFNQFAAPLGPTVSAAEIIEHYYRILQQPPGTPANTSEAQKAVVNWALWEARISTLITKPDLLNHVTRDPGTPVAALIGNHYFQHQFFIKPNEILDRLARITHLPAMIVHGRYDIVCPLDNAHEIAVRWPKSQLKIVPDAGHASTERGIAQALVAAGQHFQQQFR